MCVFMLQKPVESRKAMLIITSLILSSPLLSSLSKNTTTYSSLFFFFLEGKRKSLEGMQYSQVDNNDDDDEWVVVDTLQSTCPVFRITYDVFEYLQTFMDDASLLNCRLVCHRWGEGNAAMWHAVAVTMKEARRHGKKQCAAEIAIGAAKFVLGATVSVVGVAAVAACVVYGGQAGLASIVALGGRVVASAVTFAADGAHDALNAEVHAPKSCAVITEVRDASDLDVVESDEASGALDVCVVVERQRYSVWRRKYSSDLLPTDPPPFTCNQFPLSKLQKWDLFHAQYGTGNETAPVDDGQWDGGPSANASREEEEAAAASRRFLDKALPLEPTDEVVAYDWVGSWRVVKEAGKTDEAGWSYGATFIGGSDSFSAVPKAHSFVRARTWQRQMRRR